MAAHTSHNFNKDLLGNKLSSAGSSALTSANQTQSKLSKKQIQQI